MKHYEILSLKDDNQFDCGNLAPECIKCKSACNSTGMMISNCPIYNTQRRQGVLSNSKCIVFLCDETKTTKLFRDKIEALSYSYPDLLIPLKHFEITARNNEQKKVNRLIHNLTSLNAHNIQELDSFIPQSILTAQHKTQLSYITNAILQNPTQAAKMFIRISKHNLHMKTEFSVYQKLDKIKASYDFKQHSIVKVIENVLYTFFTDFNANGIIVDIAPSDLKIQLDYESCLVALYHLIDNASKYAEPDTNIKICIEQHADYNDVVFEMNSLYIYPTELNKLFEEGYSGSLARDYKLKGDGIGMYQIKRMMKINNGDLLVLCGDIIHKTKHRKYSDNKFILRFFIRQDSISVSSKESFIVHNADATKL